MADEQHVRVLPPTEVEALLTELAALISTLPPSLPLVPMHESKYNSLIGFQPDSELVEDVGEVGAVNTALERMFGHRQDGLKILERGKAIESIVPLLEKYLHQYSGDIILQKWLLDFVSAARLLRPKRAIKQTEKAREADLKRKAPDTSDTSISVSEIGSVSESESSSGDFAEPDDSEDCLPSPTSKTTKSTKPRKIRKTGPLHDATPTEIDERYEDVKPVPPKVLRGGAPRNQLADRLVIGCYIKGKPRTEKTHRYRCIASSVCDHAHSNTKRQIDRILGHAVRCTSLRKWKPDLFAEAEIALAKRSPGAKLAGNDIELGTKSVETPEVPERRVAAMKSFFAPFDDQGKLDTASRINLVIVRLLCSSGVPPRIADSRDWKRLFYAINPRLSGYTPPSSTTLRDRLIPAEARQAVLNARRFLKTQRNLSLSFDGLTEGSQPVYMVHVATSDRQSFLLRGDVFYGSHNSAYITDLLEKVIKEIGVERFASVVSNDTNVTKKARRDLVAKYPTIINLADPCHKLNLVIQDICADKSFTSPIQSMKSLLSHFNHSTAATAKLQAHRKALGISSGLRGIGKTRFATMKISGESVTECMPALYRMNAAGELDNAPADVQQVTKQFSLPAMTFMIGLKKLISVVEPFARPLLCLESSNATIGDTHLMWMAGLAMADDVFCAPDSQFTSKEVSRFRQIINRRFNETINAPPSDVYILGSFGDPRMRNMRIYRNTNPLAPSVMLPALRGVSHTPNTSPCGYISNSIWARIRKAAIEMLRAELMLAEENPTHPLSKYVDAQQAKHELDTQLIQYACSAYPFDQPLGQQAVLEYWSTYMVRPDTKVLGFIFTKLFSVIPNSMNDERTGSRMTFLYSKLRSRTDVNTMVEQIQVKQWYQLIDEYAGNVKRPEKNRPVLRFRQLSSKKQSPVTESISRDGAIPVALNDEAGDDWLTPEARASEHDKYEPPSNTYDHLEFVDLKSAALADFLSDTPPPAKSDENHGTSPGHAGEQVVRKVAEVNWD